MLNLRWLSTESSPAPVELVKQIRDDLGIGMVSAKQLVTPRSSTVLQQQLEDGSWVNIPEVHVIIPWVDPR